MHDYLFANTQFICYKITSFKKGIEIKIEYLRKYKQVIETNKLSNKPNNDGAQCLLGDKDSEEFAISILTAITSKLDTVRIEKANALEFISFSSSHYSIVHFLYIFDL